MGLVGHPLQLQGQVDPPGVAAAREPVVVQRHVITPPFKLASWPGNRHDRDPHRSGAPGRPAGRRRRSAGAPAPPPGVAPGQNIETVYRNGPSGWSTLSARSLAPAASLNSTTPRGLSRPQIAGSSSTGAGLPVAVVEGDDQVDVGLARQRPGRRAGDPAARERPPQQHADRPGAADVQHVDARGQPGHQPGGQRQDLVHHAGPLPAGGLLLLAGRPSRAAIRRTGPRRCGSSGPARPPRGPARSPPAAPAPDRRRRQPRSAPPRARAAAGTSPSTRRSPRSARSPSPPATLARSGDPGSPPRRSPPRWRAAAWPWSRTGPSGVPG